MRRDWLEYDPSCEMKFGDCIEIMDSEIDKESIDLTCTSIPFGALFSYSHKDKDIGNNVDGLDMHKGQFALHMRFFIKQLYDVHKPGTIAAIHIQQLLRWKVQHGFMGMRDFRGAIISLFENHGWQPHGEIVIPKNPRAVAKRIQLHSLMFATGYRDSRMLAPAMNDYVLLFRKPGEGEKLSGLIEKDKCVWLETIISKGKRNSESEIEYQKADMLIYDKFRNRKIVKDEYQAIPYRFYDHDGKYFDEIAGHYNLLTGGEHINKNGWFTKTDWVKTAHGVWDDIFEIDVLGGYKQCRENNEEKHICPLQLGVIRRIVKLYSKPTDTVLDPFMGIGSTAWVCIEQGRDVIGCELKESYHAMSQKNADTAYRKFIKKEEDQQISIFDWFGCDSKEVA